MVAAVAREAEQKARLKVLMAEAEVAAAVPAEEMMATAGTAAAVVVAAAKGAAAAVEAGLQVVEVAEAVT